jgi:four helix bundle protein
MATHSYKDLRAWQKSMHLVVKIYDVTSKLLPAERFGLIDQLRRSAVSIPSNIAEGQKRFGKAEMAQFCSIALGSCAELETQLLISEMVYKIKVTNELQLCEDVSKMLAGLIKSLERRTPDEERNLMFIGAERNRGNWFLANNQRSYCRLRCLVNL